MGFWCGFHQKSAIHLYGGATAQANPDTIEPLLRHKNIAQITVFDNYIVYHNAHGLKSRKVQKNVRSSRAKRQKNAGEDGKTHLCGKFAKRAGNRTGRNEMIKNIGLFVCSGLE